MAGVINQTTITTTEKKKNNYTQRVRSVLPSRNRVVKKEPGKKMNCWCNKVSER